MAFIPDTAIERSHELKPSAFSLYVYYCMRRNKETGTCFPKLKRAAADLHLEYTYASKLRTELITKGWIIIEDGEVRPLVGFEVAQDSKESCHISNIQNGTNSTATQEKLPKEQIEVAILANESCDIGNSLYIEPAQLTSPINQEAAAGMRPPVIHFVPDPDNPLAHPAVVEYNRVMKPNPGLSIRQCEVVAANVTDMAIWDQVLTIFAGNEHRGRDGTARAVGNAIDRYRKEVMRATREGPGKPIVKSSETPEQKQARLQRQQQQRTQQRTA